MSESKESSSIVKLNIVLELNRHVKKEKFDISLSSWVR